MQKADQGNFEPFDAKDWKIGIVVAQVNRHITDKLHKSALDRAVEYQLQSGSVVTAKVTGSGEIPLMLQAMAESRSYRALMAIGCVIKGETDHFEYISKFVTEGILRVQLDYKQPIAFGILTCNTEEQAAARTHLGGDHLDAVMHQARDLVALKG